MKYVKYINLKLMVKIIFIALIVLDTISYTNAILTQYNFNDSTPELMLDFTNNASQSFFITIPNEYVLQASMDMEGLSSGVAGDYHSADVIIVTDSSGSMGGKLNQSSSITKLQAAKNASTLFINIINTSYIHIGLSRYYKCPTYANDVLGITTDKVQLINTINSYVSIAGTNIARGLEFALQEINSNRSRPDVKKYMLLMTDGRAHEYYNTTTGLCNGPDSVALELTRVMARNAAANNITIFTVGLGADADMVLLRYVANITGGESYFAPSNEQLMEIYSKIAQSISTLAYPTPYIMTVLPNSSEVGWNVNTTLNKNVTWFDKNCGFDDATCVDFTSLIQRALDSCYNDTCRVNFKVTSNTTGKILLSNFRIDTIQNGKCGRPSCRQALALPGFNVTKFEQDGCSDGVIKVNDPFVFKYVQNMYSNIREVAFNVSYFNVMQPSSGNYLIQPNFGNRTTRFKIIGTNVTDNDRGVGVIQVVLMPIPNKPLTYCPILLKESPYDSIESSDIDTELLVANSRAATGYNPGDLETQGPYVFSAKVWLRK